MPTPPQLARGVVAFWRAAGHERRFAKDPVFDALVRLRLGRLHLAAAAGRLDHWPASPTGALALLILLDQAPRNLFRGGPRAFATDEQALAVAEHAVARGFDRRLTAELRWFFYLPFEHAEDPEAQTRSVALFKRLGDPDGLRWALLHADIVARFGRFPHRNASLGRRSTPQEIAYLETGGFLG